MAQLSGALPKFRLWLCKMAFFAVHISLMDFHIGYVMVQKSCYDAIVLFECMVALHMTGFASCL